MIVDGKQISVQIFKNQINNMGLDTFQVIPASNEAFGADPISISQNLQTIGSSDLLFDIKEWNDHSTIISDSKLLSKMGIKANHIPSWVTKTAKWVIDGEITEQDFVNAIKYMHASGIIK